MFLLFLISLFVATKLSQAEELGKRGEVVRKTNALACSRGTGNSKYYFILLLSCEWNYERGGGAMGVFINLSLIVDTR